MNITNSITLSSGDTAWVMASTIMIFFMIPGSAYFYSGSVRSKNRLSLLLTSYLCAVVVSVQWFLFGFSLVFGESESNFMGSFNNVLLINVGNQPHMLAPSISSNLFMIFQNMFAVATSVLLIGSVAERSCIVSFSVFVFIWSTFVYDIIAYWVWSQNGWLKHLGALDYAGSMPVHIASGFSALAYTIIIGPRIAIQEHDSQSINISDVYVGTALTWFGWFGFNGGGTYMSSSNSVNAIITSNLSASFGGITWVITEMIVNKTKKMSLYGFCCGALAGLVCVTPAAGYIAPYSSVAFGVLGGLCCCLARKIKTVSYWRFDDACDVFAVHGVGGVLGSLLTGIFADKNIASMGGVNIMGTSQGGWINGNYIQILYQLAGVSAGIAWSFTLTFIILKFISLIPFLRLRITEKEEEIGVDWITLGEQSYGHDIIKIDA